MTSTLADCTHSAFNECSFFKTGPHTSPQTPIKGCIQEFMKSKTHRVKYPILRRFLIT
jgi:hypothetical protein